MYRDQGTLQELSIAYGEFNPQVLDTLMFGGFKPRTKDAQMIGNLRVQNSLQPASRIPIEILGEIFLLTLNPPAPDGIAQADLLLFYTRRDALLRVSSHWRDVVIANPVFWTHILCTQLPWVCTSLLRCVNMPFALSANLEESSSSSVQTTLDTVLQKHVHALSAVELRGTKWPLERYLKDVIDSGVNVQTLRLENVSAAPVTYYTNSILAHSYGNMPALRTVILVGLIPPVIIASQVTRLEIVWDESTPTIRPYLRVLLTVLASTPRLSFLKLHDCILHGNYIVESDGNWVTFDALEDLDVHGDVQDLSALLCRLIVCVYDTNVRLVCTRGAERSDFHSFEYSNVFERIDEMHATDSPHARLPLTTVDIRRSGGDLQIMGWTEEHDAGGPPCLNVTFLEPPGEASRYEEEDWYPEDNTLEALPLQDVTEIRLCFNTCVGTSDPDGWEYIVKACPKLAVIRATFVPILLVRFLATTPGLQVALVLECGSPIWSCKHRPVDDIVRHVQMSYPAQKIGHLHVHGAELSPEDIERLHGAVVHLCIQDCGK